MYYSDRTVLFDFTKIPSGQSIKEQIETKFWKVELNIDLNPTDFWIIGSNCVCLPCSISCNIAD